MEEYVMCVCVCVCKSIVLHMYGYSGACFIMVSVASCKVWVSLPHEGLVFYWTHTPLNGLPFHLTLCKLQSGGWCKFNCHKLILSKTTDCWLWEPLFTAWERSNRDMIYFIHTWTLEWAIWDFSTWAPSHTASICVIKVAAITRKRG